VGGVGGVAGLRAGGAVARAMKVKGEDK